MGLHPSRPLSESVPSSRRPARVILRGAVNMIDSPEDDQVYSNQDHVVGVINEIDSSVINEIYSSEDDEVYSNQDQVDTIVEVENEEDNQCAQNNTKSKQVIRNIIRDEWVNSIGKCNKGTTKKPQVERVPLMLRGIESNKKCFDPLIVSIGPYHHNKPELQAFEKLKLKFAKQFVDDCGNQVSIKKLIAGVANVVNNARECYEEGSTENYDNESFIRMMFLDGCFVLHFMCMITKKTGRKGTIKKSDAPFVLRDLFLLENQIPSLILQLLMKFRFESEETNLIQCFLNKLYKMPPDPETSWLNGIKKIFKKDSYTNGDNIIKKDKDILYGRPHLLDLMRNHLIGPKLNSHRHRVKEDSRSKPNSNPHWYSFRSVTELESAGIHFRASKTPYVTDVDFEPHLIFGGTLLLPPIVVDDLKKPLLLNLVAYEMSPNGPKKMRISSYIWLMDSLIDNANDVKELRKQGILLNSLGSDEQLAQLFNEIADGVVTSPSAYAKIKHDIEEQCKNKIQVWIAERMYNHFSKPWTVLAFLGAVLALALTMVQTYFAVNPRG